VNPTRHVPHSKPERDGDLAAGMQQLTETFAAIAAGIILGLMSVKTRSIWFGVCLHVAVAMSMDFLALWHKGMWG